MSFKSHLYHNQCLAAVLLVLTDEQKTNCPN